MKFDPEESNRLVAETRKDRAGAMMPGGNACISRLLGNTLHLADQLEAATSRLVADRLSPLVLSEEDVSILKQLRQDAPTPIHDHDGCPTCVRSEATLALLDRLMVRP